MGRPQGTVFTTFHFWILITRPNELKYYVTKRLERLRDKHSSLFGTFLNNNKITFVTILLDFLSNMPLNCKLLVSFTKY
jgi:hypothetical protein